ncbi:MAG: glycoside hydrolase family 130 protein [Chlamydiota bacterium]
MTVPVHRREMFFAPDLRRVITRFMHYGANYERLKPLIDRILSLSEQEVEKHLADVMERFNHRHRDINKIFIKNFMSTTKEHDYGIRQGEISYKRMLLMGSYFTMEYSFESSAYFNPSIVEHPDQSGLEEGEIRVILAFRAVGEGHISSITFIDGILDKDNELRCSYKKSNSILDKNTYVEVPETIKRAVYNKEQFIEKLEEVNIPKGIIDAVDEKLDDQFIYGYLVKAIIELNADPAFPQHYKEILDTVKWVAKSHYEITFSRDTALTERVIFPVSYSESKGIEDARFVKFVDDDGSFKYYATYTAYNGFTILPKLLETKDFIHFKISPIHGKHVQNKGLALFPRKVNGQYVMLCRIDGVNNYVMFSDDVHVWGEVTKIQEPKYPWEFVQVGNCGSPVETDEGWLFITHGVGPMRTYCLGATLLDLDDPRKVIGTLEEPFLVPNEHEREGYVPNVVYTCGSIVHNEEIVIPYAMSDFCSTYATVKVRDILDAIVKY